MSEEDIRIEETTGPEGTAEDNVVAIASIIPVPDRIPIKIPAEKITDEVYIVLLACASILFCCIATFR